MSQTTRADDVPPDGSSQSAHLQNVQATEVSGWVGWIAFAGVMMFMLGSFHAIEGLVALFRDEVFLVGSSGLVVEMDYTAWGWTHLLGGILIAAAGAGVFAGQVWARTLGVIMAMFSAIISLAFISAYPIWSAIMITVAVLIIWALTVHGHEMRNT
jgi:hypothetical protein